MDISKPSDGTQTYTLSELAEKMEPGYRRDRELICNCIDGLGVYAGLIAGKDNDSSKPGEINLLIGGLVSYWGLDEYEPSKPLDEFLQAYEDKVESIKAMTGEIDDDVYYTSCINIVNGLYRYGQEMVVTQGSDSMDEILAMSDMITEVTEFYGFDWDNSKELAAHLAGEVRDMLKGVTLPGHTLDGDSIHNHTINRAVLFDDEHGFAFGTDPKYDKPFASWQISIENGAIKYESGHYFTTEEKALVDFIARVDSYKSEHGVNEKPLPEQSDFELPKRLIHFIDSEYKELFQIPDGGSINITYPPGDGRGTVTRQCNYLDEAHTVFSENGKNRNVYHNCEFAEAMERLGAKYEPVIQLRNLELTPYTAGEDKFYTYNRTEDGKSCVGGMHGDFGNSGDRYHASFQSRKNGGFTADMQSEIQSVMYALRQGLLKDHDSMLDYCRNHPEARLPESAEHSIYGFKLETDTRQYFVRCFAEPESHFAVYAYADKPAPVIEQAGKQITVGGIIPGTADENKMFYRNNAEDSLCVGYLRGDFGKNGNEFWHNWFDSDGGRNTPEFKAEFQDVMDTLRQGILKDHKSSAEYCRNHPEAQLTGDNGHRYGFKTETESRQYFIRCTIFKDDYFYVFAYDKAAAREQERPAEDKSSVLKQIRDAEKAPKPRKEKSSKKKKGDVDL